MAPSKNFFLWKHNYFMTWSNELLQRRSTTMYIMRTCIPLSRLCYTGDHLSTWMPSHNAFWATSKNRNIKMAKLSNWQNRPLAPVARNDDVAICKWANELPPYWDMCTSMFDEKYCFSTRSKNWPINLSRWPPGRPHNLGWINGRQWVVSLHFTINTKELTWYTIFGDRENLSHTLEIIWFHVISNTTVDPWPWPHLTENHLKSIWKFSR